MVTRNRPPARREGRPRYYPRRKVCAFCVDHMDTIDYKTLGRIRHYLSDRGKIEGRRKTGTCAKHQRFLAEALKRARHLALLPFTMAQAERNGWTMSDARPPRTQTPPQETAAKPAAPVEAAAPDLPSAQAQAGPEDTPSVEPVAHQGD